MNKKGSLYLIPTELSTGAEKDTLPLVITKYITKINVFIVENIRTSRRYIKKLYPDKKIQDTIFYSYGKHHNINLENLLQHIINNEDIGLLSEAGLPCIADPGSKIVEYAHNMNIKVIPITGPSSIFLALMASGMNGQNFTFNGYLPINKKLRSKKRKMYSLQFPLL